MLHDTLTSLYASVPATWLSLLPVFIILNWSYKRRKPRLQHQVYYFCIYYYHYHYIIPLTPLLEFGVLCVMESVAIGDSWRTQHQNVLGLRSETGVYFNIVGEILKWSSTWDADDLAVTEKWEENVTLQRNLVFNVRATNEWSSYKCDAFPCSQRCNN